MFENERLKRDLWLIVYSPDSLIYQTLPKFLVSADHL